LYGYRLGCQEKMTWMLSAGLCSKLGQNNHSGSQMTTGFFPDVPLQLGLVDCFPRALLYGWLVTHRS